MSNVVWDKGCASKKKKNKWVSMNSMNNLSKNNSPKETHQKTIASLNKMRGLDDSDNLNNNLDLFRAKNTQGPSMNNLNDPPVVTMGDVHKIKLDDNSTNKMSKSSQ